MYVLMVAHTVLHTVLVVFPVKQYCRGTEASNTCLVVTP